MARRKVVAEPKTEKAKRRKAKGEIVPVPAVVAVAVETFPDGGPVPVQGEPGRGPWSVTIVAAEPVVVAPAGPLLYLPDDEPEACTFNSHVFTLQPNQTTEIVSPWKEIKADEIARFILDRLERWGVVRVTGAIAVGLVAVFFVSLLGFTKIKAAYYEHKAEHVTEQRDQARVERDVARKDEAQVERSSTISTATVAAQDAHATATRAATTHAVEAIHERIREVPVVVPVPDDPVVRASVDEAIRRAQAAADRLQRAPSR